MYIHICRVSLLWAATATYRQNQTLVGQKSDIISTLTSLYWHQTMIYIDFTFLEFMCSEEEMKEEKKSVFVSSLQKLTPSHRCVCVACSIWTSAFLVFCQMNLWLRLMHICSSTHTLCRVSVRLEGCFENDTKCVFNADHFSICLNNLWLQLFHHDPLVAIYRRPAVCSLPVN